MRNGKPLVLLLEDRDMSAEIAMMDLGDRVEVLRARNCAEAREHFDKHDDEIDGMYIDALIQGKGDIADDYTYDFVEYVRSRGYQGYMVTASSEGFMNDNLMDSGCDIRSDKESASQDLLWALGL